MESRLFMAGLRSEVITSGFMWLETEMSIFYQNHFYSF